MSQDERPTRGRIAILFPAPNLGAFQPLLDASTLLARAGYLVELYALSHPFHPEAVSRDPGVFIDTACSALFLDGGVAIPKLLYGKNGKFIRWGGRLVHWGGRLVHWLLTTFYRPMMRQRFRGLFRSRHRALPYICFIGMNRYGQGLIEAAAFAGQLNVPLINWSLELSFMAELQTHEQRKRKTQETACSRNSALTIIQDQWRAQALADEDGIPVSSMLMVPNAPMGIARRAPDRRFRDRWDIPAETKILLCTGGFGYHAMNLELIEAANDLPEEFILVMQSPQSPSPKYDYPNRMVRAANPERVRLLFDPVPMETYRALVDAADVGICLYRACTPDSPETYSKNLEIMGLSSGKLADYLYSGLPVIVNDMVGPKDLVVENGCGKWIRDLSDMETVLQEIMSDYDYYSDNACRCFDEKLELSKHFRPVLHRITEMDGSQRHL